MSDNPLPCPFCGKPPRVEVLFGKPVIGCYNPKCRVAPSTWLKSGKNTDVAKTLKWWNTRKGQGTDR